MERVVYGTYEFPIGTMSLAATERGICRLELPRTGTEHFWAWLRRHFPAGEFVEDRVALAVYVAALTSYLNGKTREFDLSLDRRGTAFQQKVWAAVKGIPYGQTTTYREIAAGIGKPNACRAVGAANGANPLPLIIPCHRVIGSDGSLTGFGGGLELKQWLLEMEGRGSAGEQEKSRACGI